MENKKIDLWMQEVKRYNPSLHLVSDKTATSIETLIKDCMPLLSYIKEPAIADLGTGSGILGILYKILNPEAHVSLIERSHNKCTFLQHTIDFLDLKDIELIESDVTIKNIGPFHAIMSRAFSPKSMLEKALSNILTHNGHFYYVGTPSFFLMKRFVLKETIPPEQGKLHLYIYEPTL